MQNSFNPHGISSPAVSRQVNPQTDIYFRAEQELGADAGRIRELMQRNIINENTGQYLLAQLARRAWQINMHKLASTQNAFDIPGVPNSDTPAAAQSQPGPSAEVPQQPSQSPMELFNAERPGFFDGEGRAAVLDYIRGFEPDKDEILRIAQLVEGLENSAVEKYLKKTSYEKLLNDENSRAKSKLTAYAQNTQGANTGSRIFTKEEIGNMSGEEFTENEKAIMEQLKQGLIR